MKKEKIISAVMATVGLMMIVIAVFLQTDKSFSVEEVDIKNMAASANMYVKDTNENEEIEPVFKEVSMETTPAAVMILPRTEVFDGMTLEELGAKLDRNLGNGYIAGKGELIASYCIEKGVEDNILFYIEGVKEHIEKGKSQKGYQVMIV